MLQTRLTREAGSPGHRERVEDLERKIQDLRGQVEMLAAERAALENRRQRAEAAQDEAEMRFRAAGGKHWEACQARAGRQGELKSVIAGLESRLIGLAAGELPLALVPGLLAQVEQQDARERRAAEAAVVQAILAERDERLIHRLQEAETGAKVLKLVREHLDADRRDRQVSPTGGNRLGLSEGGRSLLQNLAGRKLADLRDEARGLMQDLAGARQELDDLERGLAVTPEDGDVGQVVEQVTYRQLKQAALQLRVWYGSIRRSPCPFQAG